MPMISQKFSRAPLTSPMSTDIRTRRQQELQQKQWSRATAMQKLQEEQYEARKADLETNYVKLGDGSYITKTDYEKLQQDDVSSGTRYAEIAMQSGIDAMNEAIKQAGDTARLEWEASHVQLDTDEWIDKATYEGLDSTQQAKLKELGVDKYNQYIQDKYDAYMATLTKVKGGYVKTSWITHLYNVDRNAYNFLKQNGIEAFAKAYPAWAATMTSTTTLKSAPISITSVSASIADATKHIQLRTGEWMWKSQYNALRNYDSQHGTNYHNIAYDKGINALRKALKADGVGIYRTEEGELEVAQSEEKFEEKNIQMRNGDWISKQSWKDIKQYDKQNNTTFHNVLYDKGIEAFQKYWDSKHIKLGTTGDSVLRTEWLELKKYDEQNSTKYHNIAYSQGIDAMNDTIKKDIAKAEEFNSKYIEVKEDSGVYAEKNDWNNLSGKDKAKIMNSSGLFCTKGSNCVLADIKGALDTVDAVNDLPEDEQKKVQEKGLTAYKEIVEQEQEKANQVSQEIADSLKDYTDKDNKVNLVAAVYDGYSTDKLKEIFPDSADDISKLKTILDSADKALNKLEKGQSPKGSAYNTIHDLRSYISMEQWEKLFSYYTNHPKSSQVWVNIADTIKKYPKEQQIVMLSAISSSPTSWEKFQSDWKTVGHTLEAQIPIYGTIKYWNEMSPVWKALSVIGDVVVVLPIAKAGLSEVKVGLKGIPIISELASAPIIEEIISPAISKIGIKGIADIKIPTRVAIATKIESKIPFSIITSESVTMGEIGKYVSPKIVNTVTKFGNDVIAIEQKTMELINKGMKFVDAQEEAIKVQAKQSIRTTFAAGTEHSKYLDELKQATIDYIKTNIAISIANTNKFLKDLNLYKTVQVTTGDVKNYIKMVNTYISAGASYIEAKYSAIATIVSKKLGVPVNKLYKQIDSSVKHSIEAGTNYSQAKINALKSVAKENVADSFVNAAKMSVERTMFDLEKALINRIEKPLLNKLPVSLYDVRATEQLTQRYIEQGMSYTNARATAIKDVINSRIQWKLTAPAREAWQRRLAKIEAGVSEPTELTAKQLKKSGVVMVDLDISKDVALELEKAGVKVTETLKGYKVPATLSSTGEWLIDPSLRTGELRLVKNYKPDRVVGQGIFSGESIIDPKTGKQIFTDTSNLVDITAGEVKNYVIREGLIPAVNQYGVSIVSKVFPDTVKILNDPVFLNKMKAFMKLSLESKGKGLGKWEEIMTSEVERAKITTPKMEKLPKPTELTDVQLAKQILAEEEFINELYSKGILKKINPLDVLPNEVVLKLKAGTRIIEKMHYKPVNVNLNWVISRGNLITEDEWRYIFRRSFFKEMKGTGIQLADKAESYTIKLPVSGETTIHYSVPIGNSEMSLMHPLTYETYLERTGLIKQLPAREKLWEYFPVEQKHLANFTAEDLYPIFGDGGSATKITAGASSVLLRLSPAEVAEKLIEELTQGNKSVLNKTQTATIERDTIGLIELLQRGIAEVHTLPEVTAQTAGKIKNKLAVLTQDIIKTNQIQNTPAIQEQAIEEVEVEPVTQAELKKAAEIVIAIAITRAIAIPTVVTEPISQSIPKESSRLPIIPLVPTYEEEEKEPKKIPLGSIAWRQGIFWKYIPPPWRQDKPITLKQPPSGAATDGRTPAQTIQMIGKPKSKVPKSFSIDMGVTDIYVTDYGRKIRFRGGGLKTSVGKSKNRSRTTGMSQGISVAR